MKKLVIAIAVVVMAAFAVPAFAAMNPFMDVPASHWAYDAIAQLASRGVISGYPDGTYKGAQPTTRYEMASALARALAKIDMEKASKQDVEMLKKLIVEFKDELDALGVKVDQLDERVAVLEKDLGGWSIAGELRFDANFGTDDAFYGQAGENDFNLNRYRIFLRKRINETTSFTARLGTSAGNVRWERYFVETKLPYDISLTVGHQLFDWEGDLGLYIGNDGYTGDWAMDMLWLKKDWGIANLQFVVARQNDNAGNGVDWSMGDWDNNPLTAETLGNTDHADLEQFLVAGLANFDINEKFRAGVMAYYWITDDEVINNSTGGTTDSDLLDLGIYAGFTFVPGVELKGIYYYQDQGTSWDDWSVNGNEDNANAWKAILDVNQDVLKFTSAWLEYGQMDNNFFRAQNPHTSFGDHLGEDAVLTDNRPINGNTTAMYGITLKQQWNDKWRTYLRYYVADYDTACLDDATNWTIGVAYRLNPAVEFELAYDQIDFGTNDFATVATHSGNERQEDDHMIRFRTFVTF